TREYASSFFDGGGLTVSAVTAFASAPPPATLVSYRSVSFGVLSLTSTSFSMTEHIGKYLTQK
ncbi:hypothetical protein V1477_021267, partial [Vespula maculifrons]